MSTRTSEVPGPVNIEEQGLKLKAFLATIRRYWQLFVAVASAVFLLGLAWILLTPANYVSTTQLLVSISGSTTAAAYQNDEVVTGRVNSYIALLTSDVVSKRVIDKLGLSMTPPELAAQISATNVPPKTSIIDVAVTAESPDRAVALANTVASEFISYAAALETPTGEDGQKVHVTAVSTASEPSGNVLQCFLLGVLAAIAAGLSGAVAVWIQSVTDPIVRTAERAAAVAGVPVLGAVTAGELASESELGAYRRVRTRVESAMAKHDGNVLEIVAADHNLDAADIASNLARALQLKGRHCVVLDYRRMDSSTDAQPQERRLTDDADSVSDPKESRDDRQSARDEDDTAVSSPEKEPRMSVDTISLAPSAAAPDSVEMPAAAEQIGQLRAEYDYVLIAAPAVLENSTASVLSDYVDAVLLIASTDVTRRGRLRRAAEALKATGADTIGLVLVRDDTNGGG
jgi:capsular polysaccharide biosynthesis protein